MSSLERRYVTSNLRHIFLSWWTLLKNFKQKKCEKGEVASRCDCRDGMDHSQITPSKKCTLWSQIHLKTDFEFTFGELRNHFQSSWHFRIGMVPSERSISKDISILLSFTDLTIEPCPLYHSSRNMNCRGPLQFETQKKPYNKWNLWFIEIHVWFTSELTPDGTSLRFVFGHSVNMTAPSDFENSEIEIWKQQLTQACGRGRCIETRWRKLQFSMFSIVIS